MFWFGKGLVDDLATERPGWAFWLAKAT